MTRSDALDLVAIHGSIRKAAAAGKCSRRRITALIATSSPPDKQSQPSAGNAKTPAGFVISGVRMLDKKPADSVKRLLYSLKLGMGYPLETLSHDWGISSDTIRSHAKRFECFKYVEREPGNWIPCALHPDTATTIKKD